jgi:hypothetical protein
MNPSASVGMLLPAGEYSITELCHLFTASLAELNFQIIYLFIYYYYYWPIGDSLQVIMHYFI